jgi:LmbE family N-acetylglucosaminyl deacetylase
MAANDPGQPSLTLSGWTRDLAVPAVALAVGAHPDDVEFGAGGTLAKWAAAGCTVHHLVCTDGSKGTWDGDADLVALVSRRQREQREAARRVAGERAGEVVFLGHVDGDLAADRDTVGAVAGAIRTLRPEVVLGHDPWKRYRLHPDHRNAGLLVCDAIVAARDPHFFPEHFLERGVTHHRPQGLLLWEADEPNHAEDVSAYVETKLSALEAHESQFETTMHAVDVASLEPFRVGIRTRLAELGAPHDFAAAELFRLITDL